MMKGALMAEVAGSAMLLTRTRAPTVGVRGTGSANVPVFGVEADTMLHVAPLSVDNSMLTALPAADGIVQRTV